MKRKKEDCPKKSQAAMEFLITYGWVILIVVIAMGALIYLDVFNISKFVSDKCYIDVSSGLYCKDFKADDMDDITLIIENVLESSVNILSIEVTTGLSDIGKTICRNLEGGTIAASSSATFTVGTACDLQARDRIKGDITIEYERGEGISRRSATGTLTLYVIAAGGEAEGPDQSVCQNAQDGGLCGGLDFVYGQGYRATCCDDFVLCC